MFECIRNWTTVRILSLACIVAVLGSAGFITERSTTKAASPAELPIQKSDTIPVNSETIVKLKVGQTIEISARIFRPSELPDNARVTATWELVQAENPADMPRGPAKDAKPARPVDAVGIYTAPTPNWSKLLHALDGDVYVIYHAPVSGIFRLTLRPEEGSVTMFDQPRWRESGKAPLVARVPNKVPWPKDAKVDVSIAIRPIDIDPKRGDTLFVETEPNDTPEQAQPVRLPNTTDDYALQIVGGADDIEYFDNGKVGSSGDDWFRLEFNGSESRLLTACLSIPDQQVAARIRCYVVEKDKSNVKPGELLPIAKEYEDGKNSNERVHQQKEQHRIAINRDLKPGNVYFLRVEANAPGYELELRVIRPAPFDDPRHAVKHALYDHLGQVGSWLNNRPRGASVERRIRDSGNLLGTGCMSCHTQSGVWGPAIPFAMGYRPQNVQLFRNLENICYQSMRPTNKLIDAANNTSLAPLDLGDGPAGTRVAGHSVVSIERFRPPRKLQSKQAIRAANFILQSGDPGGINAAGPGANVGKGVVYNYTAEILFEQWKATGEPKYFRALEDKARKVLEVDPKYTDDMAHRIECLRRYFPQNYIKVAAQVAKQEKEHPKQTNRVPYDGKKPTAQEVAALWKRINKQVDADIVRLRAVQNKDGSWGFNPGKSSDGGKTWTTPKDNKPEPSPTALALIGFQAAGFGPDDPTVAKGIKALLKLQHPSGYWKGQSQTGFVSTSYAMHALSRLFPTERPTFTHAQFAPKDGETLLQTIHRVRDLSTTEDAKLIPLMVEASKHPSPLVQYYAMIGLGSTHSDAGIEPLVEALGHPSRMVREAAKWGMRQTLIDDRGWPQVMEAAQSDDDYVREAVAQTLLMRVDGVMPEISVKWNDLTKTITHGMNDDPHPAVRAWSTRAAWNWWVWNPPVREAVNQAWIDLLSRPESNLLVENAIRYQSQALFIANGHKANQSKQHQYDELAELFFDLEGEMADANDDNRELETRLARRIVAIGATFYNTSGGDGGPGQMGYITPGQGDLFGRAVLTYLKHVEKKTKEPFKLTALQVSLEGAANVPFKPLQQRLIDYSLNGPEQLRAIAANSISDPRSAQLVAVPELIEPLIRQVRRGAAEPPRRAQLSDPLLKLFGRVKFVIPNTEEQRREILTYLAPRFDEYYSADTLKAIDDTARRGELQRKMDADWYLAKGLGDAIGSNPDMRFDETLDVMPREFNNPLKERFWLPSVTWILTYKTKLPEVTVKPGQLPPIDPHEEHRTRALRLFLDQLTKKANPATRELAVKMANQTALRRNPEVLNALDEMLKFEKREPVIKTAKNVLSTGRGNFEKELADAVKKEKPNRFEIGKNQKPQYDKTFVEDFAYFRDYVTPEMNRVLRGDQRSCYACHGVPGRVPPLTLNRPDDAGYLSVEALLKNYRLLQARVDFKNVEMSKLLRKPLNVQSGKEDGHQGGRRYQPMDPGYQILRRWVVNQVENASKLGVEPLTATAAEKE